MSLNVLLQAAEYLERREREAEHGYATTLPMPTSMDYHSRSRKIKSKKSQGNRSTHNELEKNRRAHLRYCLEGLKDIVPLGTETSRHTTLGLLTKARNFIQSLQDKERKQSLMREQLYREQRYLRRRLEQLKTEENLQYRIRNERSISECSASTSSTSTSISESGESDEVDILGYNSNSNHSDTDDHSSTGSSSMCFGARHLTISESL
ncbi:max dimerization protein 1-like [Tubulanus polymorphus]|uniref:max dimerization protein 1-like n=1 Tax=Tubulanus polymorphus TaxID=672921 RepID=UPI003DA2AA64